MAFGAIAGSRSAIAGSRSAIAASRTYRKPILGSLLDGLVLVVQVKATDRTEQISELFRQFRSRVIKMSAHRGEAEEADTLFDQVYGAVLENQGDLG